MGLPSWVGAPHSAHMLAHVGLSAHVGRALLVLELRCDRWHWGDWPMKMRSRFLTTGWPRDQLHNHPDDAEPEDADEAPNVRPQRR